MKTRKTLRVLVASLLTLFLLSGCHGDNSSSSGDGTWNQMTWDQGKWS